MENKYDLSWQEVIYEMNNSFSKELRNIAYNYYVTLNIKDNAERFYKSGEFKETLEIIKKYNPQTKTILDYNAGGGIASLAFAKEGFQVTAYEKSDSKVVGRKALEELKENLPVEIVTAKNQVTNFPDNHFDVVYLRGVLHNVTDMDKILNEAYRVLKQGGIALILREFVVDNYGNALKTFNNINIIHSVYGKEDAHPYRRYIQGIKQSGFNILQIIKPYKSEINLSENSFENVKKEILCSNFWNFLSKFLGKNLVYKLGISRLKKKNKQGRIFSFILKKN